MRPPILTHSPGTVSIFRYGAGPNGIMRTLGQFMGASGATFGYVEPAYLPPTSSCTGQSLMPCSVAASSCPSEALFDPTHLLLSNKPTGTRAEVLSSWQLPIEHLSLDTTSKRGNALAKLGGHTLHGKPTPTFRLLYKATLYILKSRKRGRGGAFGMASWKSIFGRHNTISVFVWLLT